MKNQKILLAAALLALGAASCQKEEKAITRFTAGMEQSSAKTYLDGHLLKWNNGDQVKVYSSASDEGSVFTAAPRTGDATWADLSGGTIAEGSSYTAIYPAGIAVTASSVTLPAVQHSADGSLAGFPMYAESSNTVFQSKNLCGALRIHLQKTGCTISRIRVTAGSAINGTYAVSTTTEGIPSLSNCTDGSNTTTLELGTAQSVDDGRDFYVYLPAGEYSDMQLTFYQPDGSYCTKSGSNVTVERSVCTPVVITNGLTFTFPAGCISGLFSVSDTEQVYFSCGNLQYVDGVWRFAYRQYDYFSTYNENAWDHFCWSTTATTYGMSTSRDLSEFAGDFVDWGTAINPDGGGNPWRTLTNAEWQYLLGTNSQRDGKYGLATITGVTLPDASSTSSVTGLVILPDGWTSCPGGCSFAADCASGYGINQYNTTQWAQMEAAGAVFLPAAGCRRGTDMESVGSEGDYWSSNPLYMYNIFSMHIFDFGENNSGVDASSNGYWYFGQSVRLVQNY